MKLDQMHPSNRPDDANIAFLAEQTLPPFAEKPCLLCACTDYLRPRVMFASPVPFEKNLTLLGDSIAHQPGSPDFLLLHAGCYEVHYAASVMSPDCREVGAQLTLDDQMIAGTYSGDTVCDAHEIGTLSGISFFEIKKPAVVRLLNAADQTIYSTATLSLRRLDHP